MRRFVYALLLLIFLSGIGGCTARDNQSQSGPVLWFSPNGYEALFDHSNLHDIEIVISQEAWDAHIRDMKEYAAEDSSGYPMTGVYQKATFIYRGPAGGAVVDEVGFRTKGRSSRAYPQDENGDFHRAHFKIRFNEAFDQVPGSDDYDLRRNRRFCTLRSLNLRVNITSTAGTGGGSAFVWEPTHISRAVCYDLANKAGVYTSRTGFARLTITIGGESHYFGIYDLIEPIDKSFLTQRYGKKRNDGNLYKCAVTPSSGPATLEPMLDQNPFPETRTIGIKDWESHYRPTYDLKTNEEEADHTVLLDFIENLDSLKGELLKKYLDDYFEVDRFLKHQALAVLFGKWDDYWTMGNNYYLYFNNGGKIEFIPCDYDIVLGHGFNIFYTPSIGIYEWSNQYDKIANLWTRVSKDDMPVPDFASPLIEKMLEIDEYREKYEQYFIEFITPSNELFVYSQFDKKYEVLYELLAPHVHNDTNESEDMINDGSIAAYYYERTRAVIDELGLDKADYETEPGTIGFPTNVEASDGESDSTIIVKWEEVPLADYYEVFRSDAPDGPFFKISNKMIMKTFKDTDVGPGSTYYYKVKSYTEGGVESAFSSEVRGYMIAYDSSLNDSSVDPDLISAPDAVSATEGAYNDTIMVTWDAVSNSSYYQVYKSDSVSGPYEQTGKHIRGTIFYDQTVTTDTLYYYKVKACNTANVESEFSEAVGGFTSDHGPSGPEIMTGSALIGGTYSLTNDQGITTYVFNNDGTYSQSTPDVTGMLGGDMKAQGDWSYDGNALIMNSTMELIGGMITVQTSTVWDNAFTIDDGSNLELMGLKQVRADSGDVVMKFKGNADIVSSVEGMGTDDEYDYPLYTEVGIKDDGAMEITYSEVVFDNEGGNIQTKSETRIVEGAIRLIEFEGCYYLYPVKKDNVYTSQ